MFKSLQVSVLLSMLLSTACSAAEPSVCKALCAEEKRACRADARRLSEMDADKPSGGALAHRDARVSARFQDTPQQEKAGVDDEFGKRKRERENACDSKAASCSRSCAAPAPDSIMVKPKTQQ